MTGRTATMRALLEGEPRRIGRFRVVGVIGSGGMGKVFLGVGPDGRLAAVKQVHASLASDKRFHARFAQEVAASRMVSGAFAAAVLDADTSGDMPWLASVFVPGPSLEDAVVEHGPLPEPALWRLAGGLALALAEIHRVGLVHRDLKPSNVLLTADGPRVIDFGIALNSESSAERLTQAGAVVGSPSYMSPEQVEGEDVGPASDFFTLGGVLTYAASGVGPFGHGLSHELIYRVVAVEPDISRLPSRMRPLVAACLSKNPARRPSVDDILHLVGALSPDPNWLPEPVRRMIDTAGTTAARLAGVPAPAPVVAAAPAVTERSRETVPVRRSRTTPPPPPAPRHQREVTPPPPMPPPAPRPSRPRPQATTPVPPAAFAPAVLSPAQPRHQRETTPPPPHEPMRPLQPSQALRQPQSQPRSQLHSQPREVTSPPPPAGPASVARRSRRPLVLAGTALVLVAAATVGAVTYFGQPVATPGVPVVSPSVPSSAAAVTAQDAAAIVTAIRPSPDKPPVGFRLEPPATGDPTVINRSGSQFACDVQADPPLPAESAMTAATGVTFMEDVGELPNRFRDRYFYNVMYLDPAGRADVLTQLRGRIGECRTKVPPQYTAVRFSNNTVAGADEIVGFIADLPVDKDFAHFPPQVVACDFARVDAVVMRGCALITRGSATEPANVGDSTAMARTRDMLAPLIRLARTQQGAK
ncbi:serine/threonine-protein kinase [Pseudonocardia sp. TRM90224]|uniref:serine/threonine-protein kinase n=1 Tax=Pseudonocardia sp. TRM90224 TaxID=2812678 RepID=UPI001E303FB0|nr:serine/threonine-protein kinase [Pseudonocardia sp. TRM90224]